MAWATLQGFDDRAALDRFAVPRLVFAGADDTIEYGPRWDGATVVIGDAVAQGRDELHTHGWVVHVVPDADHMRAMQADAVLPILIPFLRAAG